MTLLRLNEIDPQHRRTVRGKDIRQFQVYSSEHQLLGKVVDALLDREGQFYYLMADLHQLKEPRQVLIPLRQTRVDLEAAKIYLSELDERQVTELPTYSVQMTQANSHLSQPSNHSMLVLEESVPLEMSRSLESDTPLETQVSRQSYPVTRSQTPNPFTPTSTVNPLSEPTDQMQGSLAHPIEPTTDVVDEHTIRLLEERLLVDRQRRKIGEVIVRKEIETQIIEVPVRREKLIVEQISPTRQQLASIDLSSSPLNGSDWVDLKTPQESPVSNQADVTSHSLENSVIRCEFPSIQSAIEFLRAIATQPDAHEKGVKLSLISN